MMGRETGVATAGVDCDDPLVRRRVRWCVRSGLSSGCISGASRTAPCSSGLLLVRVRRQPPHHTGAYHERIRRKRICSFTGKLPHIRYHVVYQHRSMPSLLRAGGVDAYYVAAQAY